MWQTLIGCLVISIQTTQSLRSTSDDFGLGSAVQRTLRNKRYAEPKAPVVCNPCGKIKKEEEDEYEESGKDYSEDDYEYEDIDTSKLDEKGQRLVGGRDVTEDSSKPWFSHIEISDAWDVGTCGGSLINRRFIITAAHCFCKPLPNATAEGQGTCRMSANGTIEVMYITKIRVSFAAIIRTLTFGPLSKTYEGSRVIVHPKFSLEKFFGANDIALLQIKEEVQFTTGRKAIMPICLPTPDTGNVSMGWIIGMGTARDARLTDKSGPEKFEKCMTPCKFDESPAVKDPACQEFNQQIGDSIWEEETVRALVEVVLYYNGTNETCWNNNQGKYGWCETKTNVTSNANWGYCNKEKKVRTDLLQQANIQVLSKEECLKLQSKHAKFEPDLEFCAGFKYSKKILHTYNVTLDSADRWNFDDENKTTVPENTVGGIDTCQGDSGNGFFVTNKEEDKDGFLTATIYGVTSRGMRNCGEKASAGIYTRVTEYLDWIYENIKEGECTGDDLDKTAAEEEEEPVYSEEEK